mmetsp:Transcript_28497/g.81617  ORF Transcript_28497/g.81617 Transcript_28497/m.81617 type:complete len:239 (+) Transcript_28497:325-1041(+)
MTAIVPYNVVVAPLPLTGKRKIQHRTLAQALAERGEPEIHGLPEAVANLRAGNGGDNARARIAEAVRPLLVADLDCHVEDPTEAQQQPKVIERLDELEAGEVIYLKLHHPRVLFQNRCWRWQGHHRRLCWLSAPRMTMVSQIHSLGDRPPEALYGVVAELQRQPVPHRLSLLPLRLERLDARSTMDRRHFCILPFQDVSSISEACTPPACGCTSAERLRAQLRAASGLLATGSPSTRR